MKNLMLLAILSTSLFQSMANATPFIKNSSSIFEIYHNWATPLHKRIIIDLPYQYNFRIIPQDFLSIQNEQQLESAINNMNDFYARTKITPIHACIFSDTVVIQQLEKECNNIVNLY